MITIIFGLPGAGKTAFMTYLLKSLYERKGDKMLDFTCRKIRKFNRKYDRNFSFPKQTPIYVNQNYHVKFTDGYDEYFTPYTFDVTKFGVPIKGIDPQKALKNIQFVAPGSTLFVPEGQKFLSSYEWKNLPKETRVGFEEHRQFWMDFYIDVQRPVMIAAPVREIAARFIRILKHENTLNFAGGVDSTTFHTLEFGSWQEADANIEAGKTKGGEIKKYTYTGNIFKCYDSFSCSEDFIPAGSNQDFIYVRRKTA